MRTITNDFKTELKTMGKEIDAKITYTINGTSYTLGADDLNSVKPHYEGGILKSTMKELEIDSNIDIPLGTIIECQFGIKVNGSFEYMSYGHYVVYSSEKQEDLYSYKITCYDKMLYSMKDYEAFATYPITIRDYLTALCTQIGLTFKNASDTFTNYDKTIDKELYLDENGNSLNYTYRDVLDELAQVTASTICINEDDDTLEIRYITNAGETTTNVNGTSLSITSEDSKVNEIELLGNTTQSGTPTPSSPQEVKTVTGLQEIKAVGKNLMKMSLYNANNYVSQKLTLETGEYYVSYVGDNSSAIYLRKANGTTPINGTSVKERYNGTTLQFTISEKGNYYIQCYLGGSGFTNFSQAMLNKGTTGLPYEPYQEQVSEINLGKNLYEGSQDFSGTWEYGSSWETDSQTFNGCVVKKRAGSWNGINKTFPVVSGKTYTFSVYAKADESRNCGLYLSNTVTPVASTINITTEWQRYSITFTANSNSTIRPRIENQTNSSTNYTYIACFQLERGTQATQYSEYFTPIELCKIGTYEDKIFKTSGKNLFSSEMELGIINGSGQNEANNNAIRTKGYIAIKPETTYYLSNSNNYYQNLYYYDSNFNYVRYSETTGSFTTPSGVAYLRTRTSAGSVQNDLNTLYQLELGNQKTDYEPYSNNEWYLKKAIGKVVLNGSENWVDSGYNASAHHYTYQGANKMGGQTNLISNKFVTSTVGTLVYSCVGNASNTNITLKMPLDISTVAQMKTWLGSNITTVYFVLATPTYEKLNDTLQDELNSIRLLEGLNNITTNVPIDLTYVSGIDTLDEEYFNEDNVNFGEMYGPVNTIILSRSAESDEIAQSIPSNLSDDEKVAIKISDNQILNFDNRDEFLYGILTRLYGLRYTQNDYSSKGICYYNVCDRYKATIFGKDYYCVMLNDDVTIESGLSENVFTELPEVAETDYSKTSTTDKMERKTTLIVDKQVGEIRGEISTIDDQLNGANGVVSKLNAQGQTLEVWSRSFDGDGNVTALKTENEPDDPTKKTTYTFDKDGIRIGKSTDDYNSLQDNTGTYYYEKDTMIGKYTKDGSVQKDLALFGRYYYGIDEENFDVSTFSLKDANFVAQWYDNGTEEGFGHFWNGE